MNSKGEPLRVSKQNHTVTSLLKSGDAEIGAKMSKPPKAKHQKQTVKDFHALEAKKAIDLQKEGGKQKRRSNPKPSQNIQLCNFQTSHTPHISLFSLL